MRTDAEYALRDSIRLLDRLEPCPTCGTPAGSRCVVTQGPKKGTPAQATHATRRGIAPERAFAHLAATLAQTDADATYRTLDAVYAVLRAFTREDAATLAIPALEEALDDLPRPLLRPTSLYRYPR